MVARILPSLRRSGNLICRESGVRTYHENQAIGRDRFPLRPSRSVQPEETMHRHARTVVGTALLSSLTGGAALDDGLASAVESIKPGQILDHIKVLASDEFEGRAPGTPGEDKTIAYLTGQFQKMGLKPGNPDGTFVQSVPLVGFQAKRVEGAFQAGGHPIGLSFPNDFVGVSRRNADEVKVEKSDVVFVGYGVVAPEYGWDDYKGLDVRGKTLIMLVNDPPVPDPKDPSKLDPAVFKGRAMTYYGRWTYKYEIASEKGAAAAILVHETGPAGYPFEVVKGSWSRENFDIAQPQTGQAPGRVAVEGWITLDKAKELFAACGRDLESLKKAAVRRDFRPDAPGCHRPVRHHQRPARRSTRATSSPGSRAPIPRSRTKPSSTPRTGTIWDVILHCKATRSITARPTMPRASPRCSRSPEHSPRSSRRPNGRSCSCASPPKSKDCSAPNITPPTPSIPWNGRWPTSTST